MCKSKGKFRSNSQMLNIFNIHSTNSSTIFRGKKNFIVMEIARNQTRNKIETNFCRTRILILLPELFECIPSFQIANIFFCIFAMPIWHDHFSSDKSIHQSATLCGRVVAFDMFALILCIAWNSNCCEIRCDVRNV